MLNCPRRQSNKNNWTSFYKMDYTLPFSTLKQKNIWSLQLSIDHSARMSLLSFLQSEVLFIGCLFLGSCPGNIFKSKYKLGTFFNKNVLGFRPIYLFSLSHRDGHRWLNARKIHHLFCFSSIVFFPVFYSSPCTEMWYMENSNVIYILTGVSISSFT